MTQCWVGGAPYRGAMADDLEIISFSTVAELWSWLAHHHSTHAGVWVQLPKVGSGAASISFHDLLEAGIAYGWSESTRRAHESSSYLQKFTPRRARGTSSRRNLEIARRLELDGHMTPAGLHALGRCKDAVDGRRSADGPQAAKPTSPTAAR